MKMKGIKMEKFGLVLEGGGFRGAYTAGALAWLNDHDITFDYGVGISSGAVVLACYALKDKTTPYNLVTKYITESDVVGLKAFLKEKHYVAYRKIFQEDLLKKEKFSAKELRDKNPNIEFGLYDMNQGKTVFFNAQDVDDHLDLLRGTCALPIASEVVELDGKKLLDGGVTKMIPIERAIEQGCTKFLVITTKPEGFVRKPANKIVLLLMRLLYPDCPQIRADYKKRHLNYIHQMELIDEEVKKKNAILVRPSVTIPISRFKGDPENLKKLYQLGYQDMEDRKEEIYQFLGK